MVKTQVEQSKYEFVTAMKKPDLDIQKILFPILRLEGIHFKTLYNHQTDHQKLFFYGHQKMSHSDK